MEISQHAVPWHGNSISVRVSSAAVLLNDATSLVTPFPRDFSRFRPGFVVKLLDDARDTETSCTADQFAAAEVTEKLCTRLLIERTENYIGKEYENRMVLRRWKRSSEVVKLVEFRSTLVPNVLIVSCSRIS